MLTSFSPGCTNHRVNCRLYNPFKARLINVGRSVCCPFWHGSSLTNCSFRLLRFQRSWKTFRIDSTSDVIQLLGLLNRRVEGNSDGKSEEFDEMEADDAEPVVETGWVAAAPTELIVEEEIGSVYQYLRNVSETPETMNASSCDDLIANLQDRLNLFVTLLSFLVKFLS